MKIHGIKIPMVTILKVGIDCARKRFTTVSETAKKPGTTRKAVAKKTTARKVAGKTSSSTELPADKRPVVTFNEDGTVTIENAPTKRGRPSDYDKAKQLIIDELTERVTFMQKLVNGIRKDYEGAKQVFERQISENRHYTSGLHEQIAQGTRIGADCAFIMQTTQMLGEAFDGVKLIVADTGYNTAATWQIGELQIDFVGGRNRSFKAIGTENAEEQIVPQDIPLGRGFGELTATSISVIRDLLRAITREGKKELSKQSAFASWFPSHSPSPSSLPLRHKGEALKHVQEEHPRPGEVTSCESPATPRFDVDGLMDSHDTSVQPIANTPDRTVEQLVDMMTGSSALDVLRIMYAMMELMPIGGTQPNKEKIRAVKNTLKNASEQQLAGIMQTAIMSMIDRAIDGGKFQLR